LNTVTKSKQNLNQLSTSARSGVHWQMLASSRENFDNQLIIYIA